MIYYFFVLLHRNTQYVALYGGFAPPPVAPKKSDFPRTLTTMMYCGEEVLLEFLPEGHHLVFPLVCKRWHKALKKAGRKPMTYYSVACQSVEMLEAVHALRSDYSFFNRIVKDGNCEVAQYAIDNNFMISRNAIEQISLLGSMTLNKSMNFDHVNRSKHLENAIRAGDRESVLWFVTKFKNLRDDAVEFFARNAMFDEMKELNIKPSRDLYNALILNDDIRINQLIEMHDIKPSDLNLERAVGAGDFPLMERIISEMTNLDNQRYVLRYAAQFGNLESIKFMHKHGARLSEYNILAICQFGNLEILEWAAYRGYAIKPDYLSSAIEHGQLQIVMFIIEIGVLEAGSSISYLGGTVEIFDFLYEKGHEWEDDDLMTAIILRQLELVDWMTEKKADLTPKMAIQAAAIGNRKFLEHYWEEMKEFPEDIQVYAFENDDVSLIVWLSKLGYEINEACAKAAAENDSLSVLQWLSETNHDKNIKKERMRHTSIFSSTSLRVLRWAFDDNLTLVNLNNAIIHSAFDIIEWMYSKNHDRWILDKIIEVCDNPKLDEQRLCYDRFDEEHENPLYFLVDERILDLRDLLISMGN